MVRPDPTAVSHHLIRCIICKPFREWISDLDLEEEEDLLEILEAGEMGKERQFS